MNATCLVCTLKRSPEPSNSEALAEVVLDALRTEGVKTDVIRLADHQIDPGVVSEAVSEGDKWPAIRERILDSEILIVALPTWLGQPSSVSKRALERMDAFLSETKPDGSPIAQDRVAGVVVVGNEDGAHHCISEVNGALNDIGYTLPGQNWTYWNKGPGPGEEEWLSTDEREWSTETGKACARNLLRTARALAA
jgi:multimeric flavodoxin WrbA